MPAPPVSDPTDSQTFHAWRLVGVSELIKYIDNKWFDLQVTTVIVDDQSFPCLQFKPERPRNEFISVCVLWDFILNLWLWTSEHCQASALLIQFTGFPLEDALTPGNVICHQLLQLLRRLYRYDASTKQLCHVGMAHRRTIHELTSIVVAFDDPSLDIWLTGYSDGNRLLSSMSGRNYTAGEPRKFASSLGRLIAEVRKASEQLPRG